MQDHQGDGGRGVQRRLRNLIKLVALSASFRQTGARVRKVLDAVLDRKSEATSKASRKAVANEFDLNFTGDFDGCWADCLEKLIIKANDCDTDIWAGSEMAPVGDRQAHHC